MEQMPHTGRLKSKRADAPTFDEGRAGNANAWYECVHGSPSVCLKECSVGKVSIRGWRLDSTSKGISRRLPIAEAVLDPPQTSKDGRSFERFSGTQTGTVSGSASLGLEP